MSSEMIIDVYDDNITHYLIVFTDTPAIHAATSDGRREFMTAGQEGVVRLWDVANIGMCCKSIVAIYNPHKATSL